jgi:flavin reductase (DIM6/NTAB) family NADH-FMN oxidoreductase RutF
MMKQKEVIPAGSDWIEANVRDFNDAPAKRIGDEWMLISAGNVSADRGNWNTMTASWGGLGVLWSTDVAFCFIRPGRYTVEFVNAAPFFSLSFFGGEYHKALEICGVVSGRDKDKGAETGLTPVVFPDGSIGFKEATEVITCKKIYTHDFDPSRFLDPKEIEVNYPDKDYHRMFIGKITSLRIRTEEGK